MRIFLHTLRVRSPIAVGRVAVLAYGLESKRSWCEDLEGKGEERGRDWPKRPFPDGS
ncbi:hypothetical protein TRIP_B50697 [uncultured Desulfatiglans sp.]|uniref:Uncharacterized protein n=1 Tax=Uncultured Desulfatiglans sp. TaxID=1748965 RepID=A0A653AIK5_UNCDX|nr:hypothetical protein TRIP_B50697 [uncultured Desulfatiglans sp.]